MIDSGEKKQSLLLKRIAGSTSLKQRVTLVVLAGLIITGLAVGIPVIVSPPKAVFIPSTPARSTPSTSTGVLNEDLSSMRGIVFVHLAGAVHKPGLIALVSGSRVIDAVMRAGGLAPNADECGVNLARVISDGEQIIIPATVPHQSACDVSGAQGAIGGNGGKKPGLVSLSRATLSELETLPGVGPALAQRILDWRESHGGFTSVAQLDEVSGIGAKLLATLKPIVTP